VFLVVQGVDGRNDNGVARHPDEAKPAASARLSVDNHLRTSHFAKWSEQIFQFGITDREREIADIQLLAHLRRTYHGKFNRAYSEWKPRPVVQIVFRESFLKLSLANIDQRGSTLFGLHHDAPIHIAKQSVRTAIELFCEVLENQGIFPLCQIEISSGVRRAASLRKEAAMTVDQKIREALRLEKLKLPRNPRVVDVRIEDYVDTSGEDALRVLVVLDEKVRVEKITGREVIDLKMAIRDWLREQGVELWPYISLAKQSELDEDEDDDDDVEE
jgi:hypothetical protein